MQKSGTRIFGAVGGRRATVFELDNAGTIQVVHGFVDEDVDEDFCACVWANEDLCVSGHRGIIKVLNVKTGGLKSALIGHGGPVHELKMHPTNDDLIFSCSKDESASLWSLSANRRIVIFAGDQGHRDSVLSIDVIEGWLLSGGMDNTIRVWKLDDKVVQDAIVACKNEGPKYRAIFVQFPQFVTRRVVRLFFFCSLLLK